MRTSGKKAINQQSHNLTEPSHSHSHSHRVCVQNVIQSFVLSVVMTAQNKAFYGFCSR